MRASMHIYDRDNFSVEVHRQDKEDGRSHCTVIGITSGQDDLIVFLSGEKQLERLKKLRDALNNYLGEAQDKEADHWFQMTGGPAAWLSKPTEEKETWLERQAETAIRLMDAYEARRRLRGGQEAQDEPLL